MTSTLSRPPIQRRSKTPYGQIDVEDKPTLLAFPNEKRAMIRISNFSKEVVFIGRDETLTIDNGYPILPNQELPTTHKGLLYAIVKLGTKRIGYWEDEVDG